LETNKVPKSQGGITVSEFYDARARTEYRFLVGTFQLCYG